MKCHKIQERLYAYLTGRLSGELHRELEKHLKKCSECTEKLEEMRTAVQLLDSAKPVKAPRGFADKVMDQIEESIAAEDFERYAKSTKFYATKGEDGGDTDEPEHSPEEDTKSDRGKLCSRRPAYRYIMQGAAAAVVILAVAAVLRYGPHPDRPIPVPRTPEQLIEPDPGLIRGEEEKQAISAGCAKAAELYNRSLSEDALSEKETLLKNALDCACEQKPILAKIRNNLADCYQQQGKELMAISQYKEAITLDGSLPYPYVSLGDIYKNKGENKKAAEYYKNALPLLGDGQLKKRILKQIQKMERNNRL